MKRDANTILTHLYGIIGLIGIVVGLVMGAKADSPWSELAFFGSGWGAAFLLWVFTVKENGRADRYSQEISDLKEELGEARERLRGVEKELASRNLTLDFLAGLQMNAPAKPRAVRIQKVKDQGVVDAAAGDEKND